jgi:FkbM family methyltransferase
MIDMSVNQNINLDVRFDKFSLDRTLGLLSEIRLKEHRDLNIPDNSKIVFDEVIHLVDSGTVDAYCKDLSSMFTWMQDIELPEQPTILDIGANNGLFSLAYASMFRGAQVHSFEPVSFIFDELTKNLHMNPHISADVHAHNFGLSNRTETLKLSIPAPEQHERYRRCNQKAALDTRLFSVLGKGEKKYDAKFVPLDNWIDEQEISAVDFIKIDVEGYEYPVLEGALNTIRLFRPVVMFELNELTLTLSDRSEDEYLRFAKDNEYNVFGLQYGFKRDLLPIKTVEQLKMVSDLILVPL